MARAQRYGEDRELDRATRRAVVRVVGALALSVVVLVGSFALISLKFFFPLRSLVAVTNGWGLLLIAVVIGWLTYRLLTRIPPRGHVPSDGVLPPEHPLAERSARLAALAGVAPPDMALVELGTRNAYVVHERDGRPVVCVSRLAWEELPGDQLDAVLAHELFHIAHGDTRLTRILEHVADVVRARAPRAVADHVLGSVREMERQRELSADRAAALLTGAPGAVSAAIESCAAGSSGPDLREVLTVAFVPAPGESSLGRHATHPSAARRAEVLARVAAALGRPDRP